MLRPEFDRDRPQRDARPQREAGYQQLQRVEQAWRQLKSGLRLRPVYRRVAHRIHAHIALSVIALLLKRMAEHACADTWRNIRDDLKRIQLAQLIGPNGTLWQVTEPRPSASNRLKSLQIRPPRDDPETGLTA